MAKKYIIGIFLILSSVIGSGQSQVLTYSFPEKPWNEDLGNHRAEIIVNKLSDAVYVNIPWRRRYKNP
jgi:hypothetical protein